MTPTPKRERSISAAKLTNTDEPPHKSAATEQNTDPVHHVTAPLLRHRLGESKASFFRRLREKIDCSIFKPAHSFHRDGIYVYKRPVRSGFPEHAALLAQGGSVFHHVVVYVKQADSLRSLEFGPGDANMDVTADFTAEAPPGLLVSDEPEHPEPEHLPMLHIDTTHHPLSADAVLKALEFAGSKAYHVMRNNCIAFADFFIRILTENRVRNAPHIFDCLVGKVPAVDSPMLSMIQTLAQMTWFDVTDGSRLMREFVEVHGRRVLLPAVVGSSGAAALVELAGASASEAGGSGRDSDGESGKSSDTVDTELSPFSLGEFKRNDKTIIKKKGGLLRLPPKQRKAAAAGRGKEQV